MYTQLGVLTKGTIIEVNVSELGMVTAGGKVVFGKYAQVTNNPENDGCINAVLRAFHSSFIFRWTFLTNSFQLSKSFSALLTHCFHATPLYRLIVIFRHLNVTALQARVCAQLSPICGAKVKTNLMRKFSISLFWRSTMYTKISHVLPHQHPLNR
jgi:hypothetical protein